MGNIRILIGFYLAQLRDRCGSRFGFTIKCFLKGG